MFLHNLDEIENETKEVFSDVIDEFGTVKGILSKMESWRNFDLNAYKDAYVSLCLPKMHSCIVRLQLISWNPLMVTFWFIVLL